MSRGEQTTPQADPRSDATLLAAARAGDDQAFGLLIARHARAAHAIAYGVVGDPDLAEDVCQEALFRVWRRLGDCRDPDRFGPWLGRAVQRHALNALRGRRHTSIAEAGELAETRPGPEARVETVELRHRLERALRVLPAEQRQAVLLFDLERWSHADIAVVLGTSEAMSRQHLMLGRRRLRELLEEDKVTP